MEQCSLPSDLSSRNSIKEIPVAHEGLACGLDAILLSIMGTNKSRSRSSPNKSRLIVNSSGVGQVMGSGCYHGPTCM